MFLCFLGFCLVRFFFIISTSAIYCLRRFFSEMTWVSSGMLNRVPVKSVTNQIGDKSIRWQSTRWRQVGDRCQSVRWQS